MKKGKSEQTQRFIILKWLFFTLSFMSVVVPLASPVCAAYFNNEITSGEKLTLTFTVIIALCLTAVNIFGKFNLRSPFFILLIGLYYVMTTEGLISTLITITVCTVLDEFIFVPCYKHFKSKAMINSEIDKRIN